MTAENYNNYIKINYMYRFIFFVIFTFLVIKPVELLDFHFSSNKNQTPILDHHLSNFHFLLWSIKLNTTGYNTTDSSFLNEIADSIAGDAGLVNRGAVSPVLKTCFTLAYVPSSLHVNKNVSDSSVHLNLKTLHRLHSQLSSSKFNSVKNKVEKVLTDHPGVEWFSQEISRPRRGRSIPILESYNDPGIPYQWYLKATRAGTYDINITGVWAEGIFGEGITSAIIDDGLEYTNPDLQEAYNKLGSFDFNENDHDPMPSTRSNTNNHGTRCAGEIAAKGNNGFCGIGVAPKSKISGIKLLDGMVVDSLEGMSYNYQFQGNYIFSSSWGPLDTGTYIDGPHRLGSEALINGVKYGRHGLGSIYVVASGNGGLFGDNCNFDGYANSEYTITIGSVTQFGSMPTYAEECAAMHAVTLSSGDGKAILTTDWSKMGSVGCTSLHGGTSASAPLAAGLFALMLSVRPCLTWRDVQFIVVMTAVKVDKEIGHYVKNGAGLYHSHKHGFGMLDAWRLVQIAKVWNFVPISARISSPLMKEFSVIKPGMTTEAWYKYVSVGINDKIQTLEYVKVFVNIQHPDRGSLVIALYSPSGTHSILTTARPYDTNHSNLVWILSTIRCWGESPAGQWRLTINDTNTRGIKGTFKEWKILFIGSSISQQDFQLRQKEIYNIVSGNVPLPTAKPCPFLEPLFSSKEDDDKNYFPYNLGKIRKFPFIFNFLLLVLLVTSVYYAVQTAVAWCRLKKEQRAAARANRLHSEYDSGGGPPPAYAPEANLSEQTMLLAHYDARSTQLTFHHQSDLPPSYDSSLQSSQSQRNSSSSH